MTHSKRFSRAYDRLTFMFLSYDRVDRTAENLEELSRRRQALDDARRKMNDVRSADGLGVGERISPEFLNPQLGLGPSSRSGRVAAMVAGICLLFLLTWIAFEVNSF